MDERTSPRILLIEDNPISREFLHDALLPLSINIDTADTLETACNLADRHAYALFLCDVHLPDAGPDEIFRSLRKYRQTAVLIAVTAGIGPEITRALLVSGFREVWYKPIAMATLQSNVVRVLGLPLLPHGTKALELWDEAAALKAVGNNPKTLDALRQMFIDELPRQRQKIEAFFVAGDGTGMKSECHKLLASCGFVGAASLSHVTAQLYANPENQQNLIAWKKQTEAYLLGI